MCDEYYYDSYRRYDDYYFNEYDYRTHSEKPVAIGRRILRPGNAEGIAWERRFQVYKTLRFRLNWT